MCHAIVEIRWMGSSEPEVKRLETPEALATLVESLDGNQQVIQYRTFVTTGKRVRTNAWEDRP